MTGSFLRSRASLCAIAIAAAAIATIVLLLIAAPSWAVAVLTLGSAALAIHELWQLRHVSSFITRVREVCHAVRHGDFDQRVILPRATGGVRKAADLVNGVIDISDAFVRESALATTAASEGRFYRKIRPEGMKGAFRASVDCINHAIDRMAEQQAMVDRAIAEAQRLASAVASGDLSPRIDVSTFSGSYGSFTGSMNTLLDAVAVPLEETQSVLAALAQKDLTVTMSGDYSGDFARLKLNTNSVVESLGSTIRHLRETSSALKLAAGEILSGANDLSERTTRQAAIIEETSAAMEQLSSDVNENAKRAAEASNHSHAVSSDADSGGASMRHATSAMDRIMASSSKISSIIGLIDDIAFQTNLLALNASVEAARAGEAGKGFAVVAVEVRRLAQSAAEASQEVKALVQGSVSEIDGGSALVSEAADKLIRMLEATRENASLTSGITQASQAQAAAIEEVNVAVRQMDEMTQHNAALAEETNAAIERTEARVSELDSLVATFRLTPVAGVSPLRRAS